MNTQNGMRTSYIICGNCLILVYFTRPEHCNTFQCQCGWNGYPIEMISLVADGLLVVRSDLLYGDDDE